MDIREAASTLPNPGRTRFLGTLAQTRIELQQRIARHGARALLRDSVSRETFRKLEIFVDLLTRWNEKLNLVGRSTIPSLWHRHVLDSAQLHDIDPIESGRWLDIGTGGGFPGMVLAIIGEEFSPSTDYVLIEANHRKSGFLRRVAIATGIDLQVITGRAETMAPIGAHRITARAVSPLQELVPLVHRHLDRQGKAILPKGPTAAAEIAIASKDWVFTVEKCGSLSGKGSILVMAGTGQINNRG